MKKMLFLTAILMLLLPGYTAAEEAEAIIGQWFTDPEEKDAVVEIFKIDNIYSGKIAWLKDPKNDDGTEKTDKENPDASRRNDPLVGLNLIKGFTYKGSNKWAGGTIYDPENGKTYKCKMTLKGDQLKVRGFIGISLLGRTTVWLRK